MLNKILAHMPKKEKQTTYSVYVPGHIIEKMMQAADEIKMRLYLEVKNISMFTFQTAWASRYIQDNTYTIKKAIDQLVPDEDLAAWIIERNSIRQKNEQVLKEYTEAIQGFLEKPMHRMICEFSTFIESKAWEGDLSISDYCHSYSAKEHANMFASFNDEHEWELIHQILTPVKETCSSAQYQELISIIIDHALSEDISTEDCLINHGPEYFIALIPGAHALKEQKEQVLTDKHTAHPQAHLAKGFTPAVNTKAKKDLIQLTADMFNKYQERASWYAAVHDVSLLDLINDWERMHKAGKTALSLPEYFGALIPEEKLSDYKEKAEEIAAALAKWLAQYKEELSSDNLVAFADMIRTSAVHAGIPFLEYLQTHAVKDHYATFCAQLADQGVFPSDDAMDPFLSDIKEIISMSDLEELKEKLWFYVQQLHISPEEAVRRYAPAVLKEYTQIDKGPEQRTLN